MTDTDRITIANLVAGLKAKSDLIRRIQEALDTEEDGDALVEVARNAHRNELELASTYNDEEGYPHD